MSFAPEFHAGVLVAASLLFLFFLRRQKTANPRATKDRAPSAAPTPMPALVPVGRPGSAWSLVSMVGDSECAAEVRSVDGSGDRAVPLDWESASRNRTTKGLATSVPYVMNTVSVVVTTKVVVDTEIDRDWVAEFVNVVTTYSSEVYLVASYMRVCNDARKVRKHLADEPSPLWVASALKAVSDAHVPLKMATYNGQQ